MTFVQTKEFSKQWDSLGFKDHNLISLENELKENPTKYPVMRGTGGLRKMRVPFDNRGKRGSARVCYVYFDFVCTVYLITVYEKSDKENITVAERTAVRKAIEKLRKELGGDIHG